MVDEADREGWNDLAGTPSCSDTEEVEDNIGRILVDGDTYHFSSLSGACPPICIQHQPEKGLSFQIWPSALLLARYAEEQHKRQPGLWQGKRVLELGCGCGLVGLVFAAFGANVLLTDLPQTMDLISGNKALNKEALVASGGSATAMPLIWGVTDCTVLPAEWQHPDLVIAADVVYQRELFEPLIATLRELGGVGIPIVLGHVRRWDNDKHFFSQARKHFVVTDITDQADDPLAAAISGASHAMPAASHTRGALRIYKLTRTA